MAEHNEFGKEGEEEAAAYLIDKGYSIRHRNWHCGKKELDIVAEYRNELIVIEVKTRKNTRFGNPEDAVTDKKIRRIIASTDAYLRKFSVDLPVRFDIITLVGEKTPFTIEHIEEAYHFNKKYWNQVSLQGDIDDKLILSLIDHSYEEVIKKFTRKLKKEYDEIP